MPTSNQIAPRAHSHSRMQSYSACPLAYRLEFIDKVGKEDSDAMEVGSAAHEFFDHFVRGDRFYDATEKNGFDAYLLEMAGYCFQKSPRRQDNFKAYLEICKTFSQGYQSDSNYPEVKCELQIAVDRDWKPCGWFDPNVWFRAKLDRLDLPKEKPYKRIRIQDYKSGFSGSMDGFQLDIYALLASILYPEVQEVEVSFYYVQSGFKQTKLLEVKDLDITKVQIEALAQRIEKDDKFKARPGARCQDCGVAAFCDQKPSDLIQIDSLAIAQQLGSEIAFLDAQAGAKKKALKAWCEKNGAVESNGLVWNNNPTEKLRIEMAALLPLCVQFHVDPEDILNTDSTSLKRLFKKDPSFAEAIAPFVNVETGMRFSAKKAEREI